MGGGYVIMIEAEFIPMFINSGAFGIAFFLMYRMANDTIKDNSKAIRELKEELRRHRK